MNNYNSNNENDNDNITTIRKIFAANKLYCIAKTNIQKFTAKSIFI